MTTINDPATSGRCSSAKRLLAWLLFPAAIFAALSCAPVRQDSPEPVASAPIAERPAWLKDGIVMVGNWEPLTFIRRRGGASYQDIENWKAERSRQAALKLKQQGVTLVLTNFYKGFGLKAEAGDIEATRQFTRYAHQCGLKVGGYIGASMMYETFFAEEPEARDWAQVDERGVPIVYANSQSFRYMACRNNPGYQAFVQKLLRIAVRDIGLDLIHFDQMEGWREPYSCHCRYCREQFRAFLRARYSGKQLDRRFGFHRLDDVAPPGFGFAQGALPMKEVTDPLVQDWAHFRCASYARRYGEFDNYIHRLNPQVALEGNPNLELTLNKGFLQAVDPPELLAHGDIVWTEEGNRASWTKDGRLVSKIRSFKVARSLGNSLFIYTGGRYAGISPESPPRLLLAEAMAYNNMNLGMVGDVTPDGVSLTPEARSYIDFFHARHKDLAGTAVKADVAVLRSFPSTEFNPAAGNVAATLFEQTLIQLKMPFDIIFDRNLHDLARYKVLVLADQDALSDTEVTAIREFVRNGGGLVATGATSLYDDWRLRRRQFALADLFGRSLPPESDAGIEAVQRPFGKGRVVYVPRVVPAIEPPPAQASYYFSNQYWKLPANYLDLAAAVNWAAGGRLSLTVKAPLPVTMEYAEQKSTHTLLLHLVNYDFTHPVTNIDVTIELPQGATAQAVSVETPDTPGVRTVPVIVRGGVAAFRVPALKVYDLVLVRLQPLEKPARQGIPRGAA